MTLLVSIIAALGLSLLLTQAALQLEKPMSILGSYLTLRLTQNPHIAFGIALPNTIEAILIAGALLGVTYVAIQAKDMLSRIAFGLIIGGALGNIIDRLPDGVVTDYISVGTFPIFNVPDICITIGAGLLLLENLKPRHH